MLDKNNQYAKIKFKIDTEVMRHLFEGTLVRDADRIPIDIVPSHRVPSRCCIYKERAVVRYRIMALAGYTLEDEDDEYRSLSSFMEEAMEEDKPKLPLFTTIAIGCSSCPKSQYQVSDACRGCFARPCSTNCPKDAIEFVNGKARINSDKCIKCGKCMERCPFHSIVHNCVPCEDSCPVGAVKQNERGISEINSDKCIGCGRCLRSCPFGAIARRSGLLPVGKMLLKGEKVVAMIAPAIEGQFEGSLEQIKKALKAVGFTEVVEVAEGAKITAEREAKELMEKKEKGEGYLATSCCPAWYSLVDRHIPAIRDHISTTLSPMGYTAQICKERFPGHKVVFIGPCIAKRYEAATKYPELIDRVLSYGELASIFAAKGIDVAEMPLDYTEDEESCRSFEDCREFAVSGGVAECVLDRVDDKSKYKIMKINGIDSKVVRQLKLWPKIQPDADLVEIMCCFGGCMAGPGAYAPISTALKKREVIAKARKEAREKKAQEEK